MRQLALIASLLVACSAEGVDEKDVEPLIADMEIGVAVDGSEGFQLVDDGDDTALSPGAQGGFHVWTAPRFKGAMGTLYLDRQARRVEDGVLVLRASRLVLEVPENAMDSWWREEQAMPSFMCPPPLGIQIYDSEIEFTFELLSEDEELLASDSLILMPRCPEGDEFCRGTCSGQ